jgi:hypothetical protein
MGELSPLLPPLPVLPHRPTGPRPVVPLWIASTTRGSHRVIDGGTAKCVVLDEQAWGRFLRDYGRRGLRQARRRYGLTFLEADWAGTDRGLFYVAPAATYVWGRRWEDISMAPERCKRTYSKLRIVDAAGDWWVWDLVSTEMDNLLTIARHYDAT